MASAVHDAAYWTATESKIDQALTMAIKTNFANTKRIGNGPRDKIKLASLRCIKDIIPLKQ